MIDDKKGGASPAATRSLDASNFFLADVRDGLGPYLAVYLLTVAHWDEARISFIVSIAAAAGIIAQTPAGALVDAMRAKRAVMIAAAILVTVASLALPWLTSFWAIAISQGVANAAGVIFAPALAAVTLGIVGHSGFTRGIGRYELFDHLGNASVATAAGLAAYVYGPVVVFYLMAAMSVASLFSILAIPEKEIDHDLARGLHDAIDPKQDGDKPSGWQVLVACRPLLIFATCATLFHFANAAMLPVVGQKLALQDKDLGITMLSACIVAAQALDGVGAGIFGALFPIIIADMMRGMGRFDIAQGAVITMQGIGAALSTSVAGFMIVKFGYSAAFVTLGAIALVALALWLVAMPETKPDCSKAHSDTDPASIAATA